MAKETHSAKALKTLELMGTTPEEWRVTEIEWVEEEHLVPTIVECPTCGGGHWVRFNEERKPIPRPAHPEHPRDAEGKSLWLGPEYDAYNEARKEFEEYGRKARAEAGPNRGHYGNCPTCAKPRRGWGMIPTGKVKALRLRKVMVGYPKWPEGTRHDSRFASGLHCHLCNKLIMKSLRVPVNTEGATPHGMWVGSDCARKFLGVKFKKPDEDALMEGPEEAA